MKKYVLILLIIGFFTSEIFAQTNATLVFLRVNPSARNAALGDAGVALDEDVYSIFFNPAGLARQYNPKDENSSRYEGTVSYAKWLPQFNFNDLYYLFWGGRAYIDNIGMIGGSVQFMNYGEINRTGTNGEDLGTFSSSELAVTLAYALPVSEKMDVGLGIKYIYSNLGNVQVDAQLERGVTSAIGVDLGMLYRTSVLNKKVKIGVALSNMGPNVSYVDEKQADPMPILLRAGFAIDLYNSDFNKIMFTYQFERELTYRDSVSADDFPKSLFTTWKNNDNLSLFNHSFGVEYWYANMVALRAGYFYESPKNGDRNFLSFGMGLKYLLARFDLAYLYAFDSTSPLADTIRLTASVAF